MELWLRRTLIRLEYFSAMQVSSRKSPVKHDYTFDSRLTVYVSSVQVCDATTEAMKYTAWSQKKN